MAILEVAISETYDERAAQLRRVRLACDELRVQLQRLPDSRQKSTALSRLDECWLWAFDLLGIVDIGV